MMKYVVLFGILICVSACTKTEYVVVQRCHALPEPQWKTVEQLYKDDVFVRSYLKECTEAK